MANKVCMSVEKVINWKWKWANHSYKIFLIKNNTKLYSKINESCGFFFFFWRTFFFVKRLWNHMKTKRLSRNGSFSSSIIFFWRLKWCPTVPTPRRSVLPSLNYFFVKMEFFFLFSFLFFPILSFNFRLPNFKIWPWNIICKLATLLGRSPPKL